VNVLFVCVDCLRGGFVDSPHADTPFLNCLVEGGIQFDSMYSMPRNDQLEIDDRLRDLGYL
jgi:hypothetical protein